MQHPVWESHTPTLPESSPLHTFLPPLESQKRFRLFHEDFLQVSSRQHSPGVVRPELIDHRLGHASQPPCCCHDQLVAVDGVARHSSNDLECLVPRRVMWDEPLLNSRRHVRQLLGVKLQERKGDAEQRLGAFKEQQVPSSQHAFTGQLVEEAHEPRDKDRAKRLAVQPQDLHALPDLWQFDRHHVKECVCVSVDSNQGRMVKARKNVLHDSCKEPECVLLGHDEQEDCTNKVHPLTVSDRWMPQGIRT
eukprot:762822-Hanusia_phi.AAC.5